MILSLLRIYPNVQLDDGARSYMDEEQGNNSLQMFIPGLLWEHRQHN